MSIKTSAALLLAASCALAVSADTIVFKSGSRLEGEIVSIAGGEIKFKSDDVGELTIKDEKVASLTTTKSKVQYKDNTVAEGALAKQNDAYTLAGKPIDMKNVKAVNPEPEKWHGSANLSGSLARGNTRSEKASVVADVNRRWEKDRLTGDFGYYFAQNGTTRDNKEKTEDRIDLGASPTSRRSTSMRATTTAARSAMPTTSPGIPSGSTSSPSPTTSSTCPTSATGPTATSSTPTSASPTSSPPPGSSWASSSGTTTPSPVPTRSRATSATCSALATSGNAPLALPALSGKPVQA